MRRIANNLGFVMALMLIVLSCKNEGSIQTYFVEHQDLPEYKALDISPKMIDFSKAPLNSEQKETLNTLEKFHVLLYRIANENTEAYTVELEKAKGVFKNEKYNELMEFSSNGNKFRINTIGADDAVDEILVLMSSKDLGFAVVRVLGDEMNPENMVKLANELQSSEFDESQLDDIMDFFK